MMNTGYPVYREPSLAEQREIDKRNGELAAALARSLRELTARIRGRSHGKTSRVPRLLATSASGSAGRAR
jgi:hypothetical protein